jgi:hypothetical protein
MQPACAILSGPIARWGYKAIYAYAACPAFFRMPNKFFKANNAPGLYVGPEFAHFSSLYTIGASSCHGSHLLHNRTFRGIIFFQFLNINENLKNI